MVTQINQDKFEELVLKSEKPVVVDFYADWCGPCKMMSPLVDELSEEYKNSFDFYKCNIDDNGEVAQNYNIMSIPTIMIFKNGEPGKPIIGAQPRKVLEAELSKF
ncbi:MAG: thioredoxin [Lachnospiraceae bacterium]|nr:thioredoxin [Lachnospiraceae bacterium]